MVEMSRTPFLGNYYKSSDRGGHPESQFIKKVIILNTSTEIDGFVLLPADARSLLLGSFDETKRNSHNKCSVTPTTRSMIETSYIVNGVRKRLLTAAGSGGETDTSI